MGPFAPRASNRPTRDATLQTSPLPEIDAQQPMPAVIRAVVANPMPGSLLAAVLHVALMHPRFRRLVPVGVPA
jgi:hypothetical protein